LIIVNDLNPGGGELNPEGVLEDHQRSDVQDRPMLLSIKMVVDEDPHLKAIVLQPLRRCGVVALRD
jgi:hypothetical protein